MKMKVQALAKVASNPELEAMLKKKDTELKDSARKNAKHYASNNQPAPMGDKIGPYIEDIKTAYEALAAHARQYLQTGTHLPEGQIEADRTKEKCKALDTEISKLEDLNKNDSFELQHFDAKSVWNRIFLTLILTGIILIGEIAFNTKAFEVAGESLLFALTISVSVSFAVFILSHVAPILYKEITNKLKRRIFVISILTITMVAFYVLGIFRSTLFAQNSVSISPGYFVVINLFLFMVSVFLSYYLFPTLEEIKGSIHNVKLHLAISKRKKAIAALKVHKDELKHYMMELAKQVVRINYYTEYIIKRIEKMYFETVGIFKSINITFRQDRKVPTCFNDEIPRPELEHLIVQPFLNNEAQ